jgi:hypothetical protein
MMIDKEIAAIAKDTERIYFSENISIEDVIEKVIDVKNHESIKKIEQVEKEFITAKCWKELDLAAKNSSLT